MDYHNVDRTFRSGRRKNFFFQKRIFISGTLLVLTLLSLLSFYLLMSKVKHTPKTLKTEVPNEIYEEILGKFYNFSGGNEWYNKEIVSQQDNKLVRVVRDNWIIDKSQDINQNYSLEKPELEDPSMGQAEAIRKIFKNMKNGFFIECGAYDGETRSNTLNLERFYGWTGLLIEADPINYSKMVLKNRKAYLSPTCLSITPRPQIANFLMANNIGRIHEPIDSAGEEYENSPDIAHTGKHIEVQCFPLATYLFALNRTTVDYFSLDIEGNEIDVLETIPFDQVDIKTLSVEYVHNKKGKEYMIDLMEKNGYYVHSYVNHADNLANDIIFVKKNFEPSTNL